MWRRLPAVGAAQRLAGGGVQRHRPLHRPHRDLSSGAANAARTAPRRSQLLEAEGLILEPLAAVASLFALRLDRSNRVDFFGDTGGDGLPLAVQPTLPECDQTIPVKFQTAN
jgi:hypothetical protein